MHEQRAVIRDGAQVDTGELHALPLRTLQREQVVSKASQTVTLTHDLAEEALLHLLGHSAFEQGLRRAAYRGERRADLMADVAHELGLTSLFGTHLVDGLAHELADLAGKVRLLEEAQDIGRNIAVKDVSRVNVVNRIACGHGASPYRFFS